MKKETYLNLGKSLHVFNEIELFLSLIITHHIEPKDKTFFIDYILNPSVVSFGAKLKILINLNIFNKSEIEKIRRLSTNRNVFAHSNRTENIEVQHKTTSEEIEILVNDVIIKTNSSGKLTEKSYSNFVIENKHLQNEVIELISEYINSNQVDTHHYHLENLILLKNNLT